MSFCKSCDAEIRWVLSSNGKRMPVDRSSPDGNLYLLGGDPTVAIVATSALGRAIQEANPEKRMHTSHFATCPNAERHRK